MLQAWSKSSPVERPIMKQAVPLQPMGPTAEQISMLQPVEEPPVEQVDVAWRRSAAHGEPPQEQALGRSCSPWRGAHAGAGGLGGAAARGGHVLEQFAPGGWMDPVVRSHVGAVLEELLPVGSPRRLSSGRTASRGRDLTGSRGRERDPDGAAEMKRQGLTAAPSPHLLWGEKVEESGC